MWEDALSWRTERHPAASGPCGGLPLWERYGLWGCRFSRPGDARSHPKTKRGHEGDGNGRSAGRQVPWRPLPVQTQLPSPRFTQGKGVPGRGDSVPFFSCLGPALSAESSRQVRSPPHAGAGRSKPTCRAAARTGLTVSGSHTFPGVTFGDGNRFSSLWRGISRPGGRGVLPQAHLLPRQRVSLASATRPLL